MSSEQQQEEPRQDHEQQEEEPNQDDRQHEEEYIPLVCKYFIIIPQYK